MSLSYKFYPQLSGNSATSTHMVSESNVVFLFFANTLHKHMNRFYIHERFSLLLLKNIDRENHRSLKNIDSKKPD